MPTELKMKFETRNKTRNTTEDEESPEKVFFLGTGLSEDLNSVNIITWRSSLAQLLAGSALCLTSISIGMMLGFITLAIGELRHSNEDFSLDEAEASWFGSVLYLLQPPFGVLGGILHPYVGCKHGLMITFLLQLLGWLFIPFAQSALPLYIAAVLFGVSAGSLEAPAMSYIGEITQPRIRSMLLCSTTIAYSVGTLFLYLLGAIFPWRTVAAIGAAVPIIAIISMYFIPESPIWLLSKDRREEATKSLCWLRGWVSPDYVQIEFKSMCQYVENSKSSNYSIHRSKNSIWKKFKENITLLWSPEMRKPFILIVVGHFAGHSSTLTGMKSYLIEILRTMQIPIKPQLFTFLNSIFMIFGGLACISVVKFMGKRFVLLVSLLVASLMCIVLGFYTFYMHEINLIWIPSVSILVIHLAMTFGLVPVPWMLTSELFPLKGRSMGVGLAAAFYFIIGFLFSKTYYTVNGIISLPGCFILYGVCGFLSLIYLYLKVPETEGKTLAEIEEYFLMSPEKRKINGTGK